MTKKRPLSPVHLGLILTGRCPSAYVMPLPHSRDACLVFFSDLVERIMEVYMDDITVYGGSFEECLINLETVLHRCIEKILVLN